MAEQDVKDAAHGLMVLTICRCDTRLLDRGQHSISCMREYREDVRILAQAAGVKVAPW